MDATLILILVSLAFWQLLPIGYQFTSLNPIYSHLINDDNVVTSQLLSIKWLLVFCAWPIGACIGSACCAFLAMRLSRKSMVFILSNIFLILGGILTTFEPVWSVVIGRLVCGLGTGITFSLLPMYLEEISSNQYIGVIQGSVTTAFYIGSAISSVLSLQKVMGAETMRSYFFVISPFMALMTLILSPLFPESPKYLFWQRKAGDDEVIEQLLRLPYNEVTTALKTLRIWQREEIQFTGTQQLPHGRALLISCLSGFFLASMGPLTMMAYSRPILTYLNYSSDVSASIEACVATIYASFALLSIVIWYIFAYCNWSRFWHRCVLLCACAVAGLALFAGTLFVLLYQYSHLQSHTSKLGFLWSFILLACAYHIVIGPTFFTTPFFLCDSRDITMRIRLFCASNAVTWLASVAWLFVFHALIVNYGGWCLTPFMVTCFASIAAMSFYLRYAKEDFFDSKKAEEIRVSSSSSRAAGSSSSYGTFY